MKGKHNNQSKIFIIIFIYIYRTNNESTTFFEASQRLRTTLSTPELNSNLSMKQRMSLLESAIESHAIVDEVTYQNIVAVAQDTAQFKSTLEHNLETMVSKLTSELNSFKQEVHHRFELQTAENKRLIQHISTLKAENQQLQRDLVSSCYLYLLYTIYTS
jgi:hypothetical protein